MERLQVTNFHTDVFPCFFPTGDEKTNPMFFLGGGVACVKTG